MGQETANGTNGVSTNGSSTIHTSCRIDDDIAKYRGLFPVVSDTSLTYLNASFMLPTNLKVKSAIDEHINEATYHPHPKPKWQQTASKAKELLAEYLNVDFRDFVVTRDTTEGLNIFQRSLKWQPGANVVVLDTEHPNHVYGWLGLIEQGLEIRHVAVGKSTFADASTFAPYVDEHTVAIGLSSVMFHNGQLNDVRDICEIFRPKGVEVLVDITQHVGVASIDLRAWNVSAAAFGCHKGLGCPTGLGILYINPNTLPLLKRTPPMVGAGAIANLPSTLLADPNVEYYATTQRYEHLNICLVATTALHASLDFLLHDVGISRLENHLRVLGFDLTSRCKSIGVDVVGSSIAEQRAPHLYVLKLLDPQWKEWFEAEKIYVSHYRDGVRVSLGLYNNLSDIHTLIASIERGLGGGLPRR